MKSFLFILFFVALSPAQHKFKPSKDEMDKFGDIALAKDTSHYPGAKEVLRDSSNNAYMKMILAPQQGGFYVGEGNIVYFPIPASDLTQAKLNLFLSEIQAVRADAVVARSKAEVEKEKK